MVTKHSGTQISDECFALMQKMVQTNSTPCSRVYVRLVIDAVRTRVSTTPGVGKALGT